MSCNNMSLESTWLGYVTIRLPFYTLESINMFVIGIAIGIVPTPGKQQKITWFPWDIEKMIKTTLCTWPKKFELYANNY